MIKYLKYSSFLNLIFIVILIFACKNIVKLNILKLIGLMLIIQEIIIFHKKWIYIFQKITKKHPAVIVIYGSGWSSNNKKLSNYQKDVFVKP